MTFVAALRHDHIEAPWLIDGPINSIVERALVPTLKPGYPVIMDNLGSLRPARLAHRSRGYAPQECANYFAKISPNPI